MKNAISILISSLCLLASSRSFGQNSELLFPVEKSQIRILPQRFEYHLIDANRFQVGNMLIQATDIGIRTSSQKKPKWTFFWPSDLLDSGEIVVKDSSGKALWQRNVSKAQVQIKNSSSGTKLATVELTAEDDEQLLQMIQRSAFFRFCAQREAPQTKIYFCSKDLYLLKKSGTLSIQARDSLRPDSYVEINGELVDRQGFIFLNSSRDPLSLRALMLSGATLELETHMKDVSFQDVVLSADEKNIIVSAKNKETIGTQESADSAPWMTTLDIERPSLYLKGEGNIPLKQEFLIEGPVRKAGTKVFIESASPESVSSSSLALDLKVEPSLRLEAADRLSTLEKTGNGLYTWKLKNLRRNEVNRRYVKAIDSTKTPAETFWAAYDVKRNSAFEALLRGYLPLRAGLQLLWFPSSRWQFAGRYDIQGTKNSTFNSSSLLSAEFFYRLSPGQPMIDPGFRVGAFYDLFNSSNGNLDMQGLLVSAQLKNSDVFGLTTPWLMFDARVPLRTSSSDYKVSGSFEIQSAVRLPESLDRFHEVGLKYRSFVFKNDVADIKLQEGSVFYGFGILF